MTMPSAPRYIFAKEHPEVMQMSAGDRPGIERYLLEQRMVEPGELPATVEPAGSGNMNLTLRVILRARSLILKQGRPWVEKYDHIEAPWERTLIEGLFYETVRDHAAVSGRMPTLLRLDERHHLLVLSDAGRGGDFTSIYSHGAISQETLRELLDWLKALGEVSAPDPAKNKLANRSMRVLNHEHMFRLPLAAESRLGLDNITSGLEAAATDLKRDDVYAARVRDLGSRYLADGASLVHGDYFPGSWIRAIDSVRIIDPEFCFLGAREFDYGVMLAHLALACATKDPAEEVLTAAGDERLDERLVLGLAGVEIMRRLIGVAQLPLTCGLDVKRRLLDVSRCLVLTPERGLLCW